MDFVIYNRYFPADESINKRVQEIHLKIFQAPSHQNATERSQPWLLFRVFFIGYQTIMELLDESAFSYPKIMFLFAANVRKFEAY